MTRVSETPLCFDCAGEFLLGIVHEPAAPSSVAVLMVVGGPQYRAGSHRHFVLLARALAAQGFAVLRFDHRGMGDSGGSQRTFEQLDCDIGAAIDALLQHAPCVKRIALFGLCDGASAALMYQQATADPRLSGLCLLNPWVRSQASLARTHVKHYYLRRLAQREFWTKLLSGKLAPRVIAELAKNIGLSRTPTSGGSQFQQRMAAGLASFQGPVLLLLSEDDYTAKEFVEFSRSDGAWRDALERPRLQRHLIADADHTLSKSAARLQVDAIIARWLRDAVGAPDYGSATDPVLESHVDC